MSNQLEFVGDKVLIPSTELWLAVVKETGTVLMGHCNQDDVKDAVESFEARTCEYDILYASTIEVMDAAEYQKRFGKLKRRPLAVAS